MAVVLLLDGTALSARTGLHLYHWDLPQDSPVFNLAALGMVSMVLTSLALLAMGWLMVDSSRIPEEA